MRREVSQMQKDKNHDLTHAWNLKINKTNKRTHGSQKENSLRPGRGRGDRERMWNRRHITVGWAERMCSGGLLICQDSDFAVCISK